MLKKFINIVIALYLIMFMSSSLIFSYESGKNGPDLNSVVKTKNVFKANIKPVESYLGKINLGLKKFPFSTKNSCSSYNLVKNRVNVINNTIIGSKGVVEKSSSISEIKKEFEKIKKIWNDNNKILYEDYLNLSKCAYNIYIFEINEYLEYAGYMSRYIDFVGGNGESVRNEVDIAKGELASSQKYYTNNNFWSSLKELGRVKDNIKNIKMILLTYR